MRTDLEQQLPRFAEALDREAPAISVDEILSRGTVAAEVDVLERPSWDRVPRINGVSRPGAAPGDHENDTSIELGPTVAAGPPARRRVALKLALAVAASSVLVVALATIVRTRDEPDPADVPASTVPAPLPSTVPAPPPSTEVDRETVDDDSIVPTSDEMTSGGMWPQSTLEEVRAAQGLADAGDPASTWQLEPELVQEEFEEPGDVELVGRFLREVLGWEAYMLYPGEGTARTGLDTDLSGQRYLRCAEGRTNSLFPPSPEPPHVLVQWGQRCAPTIDELHYESVSLDLAQLDRRGGEGIWVVNRWELTEPFAQVDPAVVDVQATERLQEFLTARIAGHGAEGLVEVGQGVVEIPLLYATSSGASFERYEIERVDAWWPSGIGTFRVRLFAERDLSVIEQEFFWWSGGLRMDDDATIEDGQPLVLPQTSSDGEVTVSAPSTWSTWLPGKGAGEGGHEQAMDVWFGGLWHPEEFFGSGERIGLVDPVAYDEWCAANGGNPLLSAPADAAAIAQQVVADPNFETTAPVAARIGGLEAVSMDVTLAPGGKACGIGIIEISRWIHEIGWDPGLRLRLYLVDLPIGMSVQTLAITVVAPEQRFEAFIEETAPIIDSIEFHPQSA